MLGVGTVSNGGKLGLPWSACREDPLEEDQAERHCLQALGDQGHVVCRADLSERQSKTLQLARSRFLAALLARRLPGVLLSFGSLICKLGIIQPPNSKGHCVPKAEDSTQSKCSMEVSSLLELALGASQS